MGVLTGNVVFLDSDDEFEVQRTPVVSAKVGWQGTFSEPDDCCVVKITPSSKVDEHLKFVLEDDCSIVKEIPSSSNRLPPREATLISDTEVQQPEVRQPHFSQIFTDWTPHCSPNSAPEVEVEVEVEEPHSKRRKLGDPAPFSCDIDMTLETGHDNEEDPCSVGAQNSASRGQRSSEEERQKRLRKKELELERKQFERAEKKREKEEAKKRQQEELKKKKEVLIICFLT